MKKITYLATIFLANNILKSFEYKDFYKNMDAKSQEFKKKYQQPFNKNLINKLNNIYQENKKIKNKHTEYKIPKIIHQIWIGPNSLPDFYKILAESWKKMHPDWQYILWKNEDLENFGIKNIKDFYATNLMFERADIFRLEILERFGGVYIDIDSECLKPLDELHKNFHFYAGICPNNANAVINNAIIGAIPNHPIIVNAVNKIAENSWQKNPLARNGVIFFSKIINETEFDVKNRQDILLPKNYFYPFDKHYGTKIKFNEGIQAESFMAHYWGKTIEQKIKLYEQKLQLK
jgi:mannosyltransferase OCH1-like enzyme